MQICNRLNENLIWTNTFIGLGSNLNQPLQQIHNALVKLATLSKSCLLRHSSLYRTPPIGPPNQPDYINAVALLATQLHPIELLQQLQHIEKSQGRIRTDIRWEARTLDLDMLLYGEMCIQEPQLTIPHPRMHQRAFVLIPLYEIADKNLWIPGIGRLEELFKTCNDSGVQRLMGDY